MPALSNDSARIISRLTHISLPMKNILMFKYYMQTLEKVKQNLDSASIFGGTRVFTLRWDAFR